MVFTLGTLSQLLGETQSLEEISFMARGPYDRKAGKTEASDSSSSSSSTSSFSDTAQQALQQPAVQQQAHQPHLPETQQQQQQQQQSGLFSQSCLFQITADGFDFDPSHGFAQSQQQQQPTTTSVQAQARKEDLLQTPPLVQPPYHHQQQQGGAAQALDEAVRFATSGGQGDVGCSYFMLPGDVRDQSLRL